MTESFLRPLGWALFDASLRVALLALGAALCARTVPTRWASLRYATACGALALSALVAVTVALGSFLPATPAGSHLGRPGAESPAVRAEKVLWKDKWIATGYRAPAEPQTWIGAAAAHLDPVMPYASALWLAGLATLGAWHLGGWVRLRRQLRSCSSLGEAPLSERLRELTARLGLRQEVRALRGDDVDVPMVVGLRRPSIVIPSALLSAADGAAIEALLVHELAHVHRRDTLANLVQTAIETVFFFHPGVRWLSRTARREREHCCDDDAVRFLQDELLYARSLLHLQEARALWPRASMSAAGGAFAERIRRLCQPPSPPGPSPQRRALSVLALIGLGLPVLTAVYAYDGPLAAPAMAGGSADRSNLDVGLVAHFPFDGNPLDATGHLGPAAAVGARPTSDRLGRPDAAYDFDGIDDRIEIPAAASLDDAHCVSVSCWVAPRSFGNWESWAARANCDGSRSVWRVGLGQATDEWGFTEFTRVEDRMGWLDFWVTRGAIPLHAWSHVVSVVDPDAGRVTLYCNGRRVAGFDSVKPFTGCRGPLYIGFQTDDHAYFDGKIDDLRIYSRPLAPGEVRALYRDRS
jgi:beta-lactamase regulating signal transducer with metallopeptidase domain